MRGGGEVIFNLKIYVADFEPLKGAFFGRFPKKLQHNFLKMRGGRGRWPFGIFQKIHPIWRSHPSLRYQGDSKKESRLPLPNIPSKF